MHSKRKPWEIVAARTIVVVFITVLVSLFEMLFWQTWQIGVVVHLTILGFFLMLWASIVLDE